MKNIAKGFSERKDGSMYLSSTHSLPENIINRKRFFQANGLGGKKIIAANLVHGTRVAIVDSTSSEFLLGTDALVTKERGIVLTLTGADCFPVYFEDETHDIIGLAHCGWRGIVSGVLRKTVETMESLVSEKIPDHPPTGGPDDKSEVARNIKVIIGPGICVKHFEIKENILGSFSEYPEAIIRKDEGIFIDLKAIIKIQLERLGITSVHIIDQNECTHCLAEKYFSYRRDKPERLETQVAYIVQ